MKKNDLPEHILQQFGDYISSAEVFPTKEKIYLYVESIRNKCTILTLGEYGQLGLTNEGLFYSRSNYDNVTDRLKPDPSTWRGDCECKRPNNPDLKYVQCSKCMRWFHNECVNNMIINGHFMCSECFS